MSHYSRTGRTQTKSVFEHAASGEGFYRNGGIVIYNEQGCVPDKLTAPDINKAFANNGLQYGGTWFLRTLLLEMRRMQIGETSENKKAYDALVKGLNANTINAIETLHSGMYPEPIEAVRTPFIEQLTEDQKAMRENKPEAARMREEGQRFTLSIV